MEVKSSPPRGIEQSEVAAFFSRIDQILPEVAILFDDTQLRMKDKIVVMVEEELKRRYGRKSKTLYPVNRLVDELFHVRNRIFIINSKKDIFDNFSICLRQYLVSVYKPTVSKKVVIPAKAGIQSFQDLLDAGSGPA